MATVVKEKNQQRAMVPEPEQARPAAAGRQQASWQATSQRTESGLGLKGWILGLMAALDRLLAGPPMTARERTQKQLAEAQFWAEQEYRLSTH